MLFSQRSGLKPEIKLVQWQSLDDELRNKIWNVLSMNIWDHWEPEPTAYSMHSRSEAAKKVDSMLKVLWFHYFKRPFDTQPIFNVSGSKQTYYGLLREVVLKGPWNEVFDLVESIIQYVPKDWCSSLVELMNYVLQDENSAYRIVNKQFAEISDQHEISAVEESIESGSRSVQAHLERALELLTDRQNPDFRNSIKESISAVEAMCQEFTGSPNATLFECIRTIKQKKVIHSAFEQAVVKLYAYTSDSGGIRHALTEDDVSPTYIDAKFFLVSCAAFCNFFRAQMAE